MFVKQLLPQNPNLPFHRVGLAQMDEATKGTGRSILPAAAEALDFPKGGTDFALRLNHSGSAGIYRRTIVRTVKQPLYSKTPPEKRGLACAEDPFT